MKHLAFDLDGVLIEALDIHRNAFIKAWNQTIKDDWLLNVKFHDEHLASLSTKQKVQKMRQKITPITDEQAETVIQLKQKITLEDIDKAPMTVPWLASLLASLKEDGRRIALVSNSIRTTCLRTLDNHKLLQFFDTIVGSDDVGVNKPNAMPYTWAATCLNTIPSELVAFEDSITGLKSARSAGCWIYVISDPQQDLQEAKIKTWLKTIDDV